MARSDAALDTKAVHAGEPEPRIGDAVVLPIFQTSTYFYRGETDYHAVGYVRLNNTPNHRALAEKLAALEGAEAALVTASGMAAISGALLTVMGAGDHILALDCLYGGTHNFVTKDIPQYGMSHTFVDGHDRAAWEAALRPETKVFYVETLTNPRVEMPDVKGVVEFANEHGLVSMIDNTFASPVNFRPAEHGFDLSLHSATKYLNGHSDIAAGAVIGRADLVDEIKRKLDHFGGSLDPHACFLLHRGLKTLGLRVRRQGETASRLAAVLEDHPLVTRVSHPSLDSHPQREQARELLDGYGGMMSFELEGGMEAAERLLEALEIPLVAVSLGGPETLAVRPAAAVHSALTPEEREATGVADSLIRLSVGLEDPDDLVRDFDHALDQVAEQALEKIS